MQQKHMPSQHQPHSDFNSALMPHISEGLTECPSDLIESEYKYDDYPRPQRYFRAPDGEQIDLSNVHILHQGIDTIKQLYSGIPKLKVFLDIGYEYENKFEAIVKIQTGQGKTKQDYEFVLGSGGKSGYKYRLQNNELGVIILFSSTYKKLTVQKSILDGEPQFPENTEPYSHLKIECSPHLLLSTPAKEVQQMLDSFANVFLDDWEYSGVAAHLCVDVMGWKIPDDFERRFVCRSKKNYRYSGIREVSFDQGEIAVIYGEAETLTYGAATSTQFTNYNKTKQALKTDKLEYWEQVWLSNSEIPELPSPYIPLSQQNDDSQIEVRRFELRFHHCVIDQFSADLAQNPSENGTPEIKSYEQLDYWKASLWLYGMTSYRLQHSYSYIDPMWTILMNQVNWGCSEVRMLKREYGITKKDYTPSIDRLIALFIGCALSLYARRGTYPNRVLSELSKLGIWCDIESFYAKRLGIDRFGEKQMLGYAIDDEFQQRINKKRLVGNAVF